MDDYLDDSYDWSDPGMVSAYDELPAVVRAIWLAVAEAHQSPARYARAGCGLWNRFPSA